MVSPRSEAEVAETLRSAAATSARVKVLEAGHSWSDIATTDGTAMRLDAMTRRFELANDVVTVDGGMRLSALVDRLAESGRALPILGSVTEQTVAGAIATATHGSSLRHGNLSSLVSGVRLVTAGGEVVDLSEGDPRLDAARVHLGALGVVTAVTLRVVPAFGLVERTASLAIDEAAAALAEIAGSAEYVKVWWFPHTDIVTVFRYERTDVARRQPRVQRAVEHGLNRFVFPALLGLGRRRPSLIRGITRRIGALYAREQTRRGRSHEMLSLAMPPLNREIEYSVGLAAAGPALLGLRDLIERRDLRVNFPAEVRFVKADTGWMSPAYGRDSCQIGAYMAEAPGIEVYFTEFERMMLEFGGRPHPGKEHGFVPADLRSRFERGEDFARAAFELDPHGVFGNAFVDRWLGRRPG